MLKYDKNGNLLWDKSFLPDPSKPIGEITRIKIQDNSIKFIGYVTDGITNDIVSGTIDFSGDINWIVTWAGLGQGLSYPTDINAIGNSIFVSGKTQLTTSAQYVTIKYEHHTRNPSVTSDTSGYKYQANEIIIQFNKSSVIDSTINNSGKKYGKLSDFVNENVIESMNQQLEFSLDESMAFKVFSNMTSSDSMSISRLGDTIVLHHYWTTLLLELPTSLNEQFVVSQLNELDSGIYHAELNAIIELDNLPNDAEFLANKQLGLEGDNNNDIRMAKGWDVYTGSPSAKVGIFDSGIQWSHEDFGGGTYSSSKISGGWDFKSNVHISNSPNNGDIIGHGTSVAGIVGAIRNNQIGIAGIAGGDYTKNNLGCQLYGFRILGLDNQGNVANAAQALVHGSASWGYGLHILNNSWGIHFIPSNPGHYTVENKSLFYNTNRTVFRNGAVLVYSRGNENENRHRIPSTLGPDEWKISVGANDGFGSRASSFSNWGHDMDVIAPGVESLVTSLGLSNNYSPFNGTSAAAPHVSGVAALMISHILDNPTPNPLAPEDVELLIEKYASNPNGISPGYHEETGWGRLNAGKTMQQIEWPFFSVQHGKKKTSASNATLLHQDVLRTLPNKYGNLSAGPYIVDVYEVSVNIPHNIGNYNIIDSWKRNGSSNLWANSTNIIPEVNVQLTNVSNTNAQMRGYIYHFKSTAITMQTINRWYPIDLNGTAQFGYTLHLNNPNATSVNEKRKRTDPNKLIKLYPNPSSSIQYISFSFKQKQYTRIKLMDITGSLIKTVFEGYIDNGSRIESDISDLTAGVYFYSIETNNQKTVMKTVKK